MKPYEFWNWSYVTLHNDKRSMTVKILHYQSLHPKFPKSWYRVYDHGVTGSVHGAVINECVGYGDTLEEAIQKLFLRRNETRNS